MKKTQDVDDIVDDIVIEEMVTEIMGEIYYDGIDELVKNVLEDKTIINGNPMH